MRARPRPLAAATSPLRCLACALVLLLPAVPRAASPLTLGFVPERNTLIRGEQEAQLLTSHLRKQLATGVSVAAFPDDRALLKALADGTVNLAVVPNTAYPKAAGEVELVANFTRSEQPTHELLLLVNKNRGIQSVEELTRLNPALALDEEHLSRRWFLVRQTGLDPDQAFRVISTPKQTVRAITDLITGTYDAACVESGVLDAVKRFDLGSTRQLQTLASAGPFASDPLVVRKGFPAQDLERLRDALLAMESDSLGQQVLLSLKIVRFVAPLGDLALYPTEPPTPKRVAKVEKPKPAPEPAPPPPPREDPEAKARAEAASRAEIAAQRKKAYDAAAKLDTVEAYTAFLAMYGTGPEADEGRKRLSSLETEDDLYRKSQGSEEKLAAYLALWPSGRYVRDARKQLDELRGARMEKDYRKAAGARTPAALHVFLDAWPKGPRTAEAEALLASLTPPPPPPAAPAPRAAEPERPAPEPAREWSLRVPLVTAAPEVDGSSQDAAWKKAPSLEVPMEGERGPRKVKVSMVHDGSSLYLLAEWPDGTRDVDFQPWVWKPSDKSYVRDPRVDDGLAVLWYKGKPPASACMLDGQPHEGDTWHWRAGWSEISGLAEDGWIQVSQERLPKSTPYASRSGNVQVWIRRLQDEGEPGWKFFVPIEYAGDVVPSYKPQPASGSRGDVKAKGAWKDGRWTVEMARRFQTGHEDDLPFGGKGVSYAVSFGAYDRGNMGDHTSSPVVRVDLVTRD